MLSNSLIYKGFRENWMGWKRIKTRRKMGFWGRKGGVLSLIKITAVGEGVVKYC